ncbi:MAG TPA: hypothetical protein VIY48_14435 [Candidatus Paceibacterota bacterium]
MSDLIAMVIGAFVGAGVATFWLALLGYRFDQKNKATDYSE